MITLIYGLYGLKHHIVEISGDVTKAGRDGTDKERKSYSASEQVNTEFRNDRKIYQNLNEKCFQPRFECVYIAKLSVYLFRS